LNRAFPWLHGLLSALGLYITATLTAGHYLGRDLPCGASSLGCQTVARDSWAVALGQPVALWGFVVYALLALATFGLGKALIRKFAFFLVTAAVLASLAFTYRSLVVLQAHCVWCLASAGTFILLLFVHLRLSKPTAAEAERPFSPLVPGLVSILAGAGMAYYGWDHIGRTAVRGIPYKSDVVLATKPEEWVPEQANILGEARAEATLVEFADMRCPSCIQFSERVKGLIQGIPKLRLVYRHLPLTMIPGHELSDRIAALSEIAAEKNRFWDFLARNAQVEDASSIEAYRPVLQDLGIDPDEAFKRVLDKGDAAVRRVIRDMEFSKRVGFSATPTLVLLIPGQRPRVLATYELPKVLEEPDVIQALAPDPAPESAGDRKPEPQDP
jgi:uncharacterized membrane protein